VTKINVAENDIDDDFAEAATIMADIVAKGKLKRNKS